MHSYTGMIAVRLSLFLSLYPSLSKCGREGLGGKIQSCSFALQVGPPNPLWSSLLHSKGVLSFCFGPKPKKPLYQTLSSETSGQGACVQEGSTLHVSCWSLYCGRKGVGGRLHGREQPLQLCAASQVRFR